MKGIYFDGKTATYREDLSIPEMVPGKSLIKIKRAAVCSTDKEILKGYRPDFKGIMGHEQLRDYPEMDALQNIWFLRTKIYM